MDGVQCTEKKGLVNAGLNAGWPRELRFMTRVPPKSTLEEKKTKVRAHEKFPACAAHAAQPDAAGGRSRSSSPAPPQRLQRELAALMPPPPPRQPASDGTAPRAHSADAPASTIMESCAICLRFPNEVDAGVVQCSACGWHFCNVKCSRRKECPHIPRSNVLGEHLNGITLEYFYQVYAEVAAKTGCSCSCCLELAKLVEESFEGELHTCNVGEPYHAISEAEASENRAMVRRALEAVGNPDCWLRQVVERSEACMGSCGLDLRAPGSWCGQAELDLVVRELVDQAVTASTPRKR